MKSSSVALYLRKSREEETETREATLARHERMLLDYCAHNGLTVAATYREVVSGESLDARPEARAMLEAVAEGKFGGVAVIELERLSRGNQIDQVEIMETFKKSKTKIYTLNKVYDLASENEFDEEFFEFGLFMSRREYKIIKRRLIRGKKQAQKEGYYIGSSLPYGFGKVRGDKGYILTPNEETPIVQLIFQKFVYEDYSLADLRPLNDKQFLFFVANVIVICYFKGFAYRLYCVQNDFAFTFVIGNIIFNIRFIYFIKIFHLTTSIFLTWDLRKE